MKTFSIPPLLLLAGTSFFLLARISPGQVTNDVAHSSDTVAASSPPVVMQSQLPVYHPPGFRGGILPLRVGGGSRGGPNGEVTVEVLVPDQIALTTRPQPALYWYQSKAAKTRCEVTLTQPKKARPLLVLLSSGASKAGLHAIKLSDFKVRLTPKVVYKWSVAVVVDPANRSQDIVANGIIEYVEPSPDLAAKLAAAHDSDRAAVYAGAGIWYDALDSLSTLIEAHPDDSALKDQRARLLTQVGLDGSKIEETLSEK